LFYYCTWTHFQQLSGHFITRLTTWRASFLFKFFFFQMGIRRSFKSRACTQCKWLQHCFAAARQLSSERGKGKVTIGRGHACLAVLLAMRPVFFRASSGDRSARNRGLCAPQPMISGRIVALRRFRSIPAEKSYVADRLSINFFNAYICCVLARRSKLLI
jgi:hypothetical protein